MSELQRKIEQYLNGELSETEKKTFEKALSEDENLAKEVVFQKELMLFFENRNPALETTLANLGDAFFVETETTKTVKKHGETTRKWLLLTVLVITFLIILFFITKNKTDKRNYFYKNKIKLEQKNDKSSNLPLMNESDSVILEDTAKIKVEKKGKNVFEKPIAQVEKTRDFERSELMETFISQNTRSDEAEINVSFPPKEYTFYRKENVVLFKIEGVNKENKRLELFIYDNQTAHFQKGNPILKTQIESENKDKQLFFAANISLNNGLYYFFIKEKDSLEMLYGAKFFVK